jgi:hypothetical protein
VKDGLQAIKRWNLTEAQIMHELLDQIEAAQARPPRGVSDG